MYDREYYDGEAESGYAAYADGDWTAQLCGVFADHLAPRRLLEVGCAKGFLVRRFRSLGIEAYGVDISSYAIGAAPDEVKPYVAVADIRELPWPDDSFDMVLCMETLEHVPPEEVPRAIAELARVSAGTVLCSIPSFGFNDYGPQGLSMTPGQRADARFDRPFSELSLDEQGRPHHGHVTLATYRWWTRRFAESGLYRLGWLERELNADVRLHDFQFQLYALRKTSDPQVATLMPPIKSAALTAGRGDAAQLGPGFYHFDPGLGGRWTNEQALLLLAGRRRRWLYLEYMIPAGPEGLRPFAIVQGRREELPGVPGTWTGWHVAVEPGASPLLVLLGVQRCWSPEEISGSSDANLYGIAWRYASLCRSNPCKLRVLGRRVILKLQQMFLPTRRIAP